MEAMSTSNAQTPPESAATAQYCRLSIDEFMTGSKCHSDLYVRLSAVKYIKVARKDQVIPIERIKSYKARGVLNLYVTKEDFVRYVGLSLKITNLVQQSTTLTKAKRLRLLKHTTEVILEKSFVTGVDKESFDGAKSTVESTIELISEDKDIFDLLDILNTQSDALYAHSIGVSIYSAMMAKAIGWNSSMTLLKVSMGGLLHDIGKKEIDRAILSKPRKDLSAHEVKILEAHALRGKEILSRVSSIPTDVVLIALQHHETLMGQGYPHGLSREKIHPLARLVAVANEFCKLALKGPDSYGLSPEQAIDRMLSINGSEYEKGALVGLMQVFGYPVPERFAEIDYKFIA